MPKNINPFAGKKVLGNTNSNKAPRRGKHGKPKGKQHLDSRFKVLVVPNVPCYCKHSLLMTPSCYETIPVTSVHERRGKTETQRLLMGTCGRCSQRGCSLAVWCMADWAEQSKESTQ